MKESETMPDKNKNAIAIIGMSGRFPGAQNIDEFWHNLQKGIESVTCFSDQELQESGVDPAIMRNPHYVKAGAILNDISSFDPDFFKMTAREAECLDPQHRLLLECAWETLEHAGYSSSSSTSTIGIYAGSRLSEYLMGNLPRPDMVGFHKESGSLATNWRRVLDNDKDTLATRIAYKLNLQGQAITMQTACSTSLVAVHMACQSLLNKECDIILAGGVCLRVPQKAGYLYSEGLIFSPDGHTRSFDAQGKGTIFSSGAGLVALKRLNKALADGDCIHAVIKGSAINNDGEAAKAAFTAPSMDGQIKVITKALTSSKLTSESISYIEAHGTATAHGDVVEASALTQAFRATTAKKGYCALGSVKTNIGHPTQAAGVIGLIKTVLMLKHKMLVPHLHFKKPNPKIDLANSPFYINTQLTEWKTAHLPRRAGINSFGVGGTNAHIIVEEAPPVPEIKQTATRPLHILCLSAKNNQALRDLVTKYIAFIKTSPQTPIEDLCFTANTGRTHFPHRLTLTATSSTDLHKELLALSAKQENSRPSANSVQPKIAFLFSGQGSQYLDMGRQLFETQPRFRKTMQKCDALLSPYLSPSLLSVLYSDKESPADSQKIDATIYTQTALFAIEYSLYELWKSWGVEPDFVMGHSLGEYVAACVAGIFSLDEALKLVAKRGQLLQDLKGNGAMAAVFTDIGHVEKQLEGYQKTISIAAVNGPGNIVISGEQQDIHAVLEHLQQEKIKTQLLPVSHGFHSPLVDPVLESFGQLAAKVNYAPPQIKIISNITGQRVEKMEMSCADYWRRHLREPVLFADSMQQLTERGCTTFVELGPSTTLVAMGRRCIKNQDNNWLTSLNKGLNDWSQILQCLGVLYAKGANINWTGFDQDYTRQRVALPTYPFQRKRCWIARNNKATKKPSRTINTSAPHHPLLGQRLSSALTEIQFQSQLHLDSAPFLRDHHISDTVIFPATAFIEMVIAAASELGLTPGQYNVEDLTILEPLILPQEENTTLQFILTPKENHIFSFQIFSLQAHDTDNDEAWKRHVSGKIRGNSTTPQLPHISLHSAQEQCQKELSVADFYMHAATHGMTHGPDFQPIKRLWHNNNQALAFIQLPETISNAESYQIHPVLLDACLHICKVTLPDYNKNITQNFYLPTIFEHIHIYGQIEKKLWSYTLLRPIKESEIRTADIYIFNTQGIIIAELQGLHFKRTSHKALQHLTAEKSLANWLYKVQWQPQPLIPAPETVSPQKSAKWLILANQSDVSSGLIQQLQQQGETCISVFPGEFSTHADKDVYHVNPHSPEDFHKLLSTISQQPGSLRGVVHLWGVENSSQENTADLEPMERAISDCASGLHLIQALLKQKESTEQTSLWIVTRGAQPVINEDPPLSVAHSPLWGLGRVAAREHPQLPCILIDLDPNSEQNDTSILFKEIWTGDRENQIGIRQQARYISRLVRVTKSTDKETNIAVPDAPCFRLEVSPSAILSNMSFQVLQRKQPEPDEIEIHVQATGLNFRDVLSALGKYPGNPGPPGRECAGIITAVGKDVSNLHIGEEVLAIASGSFSNYVTTKSHFAVLKPASLSFEDAATIPIVFLTAYYGLYHLGKLRSGQKVLVHATSGGVGLAAAQLIKWAGAEIYATASKGKWDFLKSQGINTVMDSRSLDFADEVMEMTDGQGVDLVLNSLTGDFIPKSISLLKQQGRFIEIGKSGIWETEQVKTLRPDVSYFPFDLGEIAHKDPLFLQSMFKKLMKGFQDRVLQPLPQKRFPLKHTVKAFRYMAQAKHIGKIVVYQQQQALVRSNSSYLITGGLGALGLRIAAWLVAQKGLHIIVLGRNKPSDDAQKTIHSLEKKGARIHVIQADVSNRDSLAKALNDLSKITPPLRGIIHAAGVLDDGVLMQQTLQRFIQVMQPKVAGAWNLHELTKQMPLDFFVLFSSISSFWGTPGQGNYATANAFLDGLAYVRRAQRLPCVSVNWGAWAEAGMAASLDKNIQQKRKNNGLGIIDIDGGLKILGKLIHEDQAQVAVININWSEYIRQFPADKIPPFFSEIQKKKTVRIKESHDATSINLLQQIEKAPADQRRQILSNHIQQETAKMIGLSPEQILDTQTPLEMMGLDSLSAIELRNVFECSISCTLPATLLYDYPTLDKINTYLAKKIIPSTQTPKTTAQATAQNSSTALPCEPNKKNHPVKQNAQFQTMVPISTHGSKPPLFFLHLNPLSLHFHLGQDQPLYHFDALWEKEDPPHEISIAGLAAQNIQEIKAVQPVGPYFLGGYSIGGLIAFEMAQQLNRQGDQVNLLFLIEPITPVTCPSPKKLSALNNLAWNITRVTKAIASKIITVNVKGYKALSQVKIPLPPVIKKTFIRSVHRVILSAKFSQPACGQFIFHQINKTILEAGLTLSGDFRERHIRNIYHNAYLDYRSAPYSGEIIILKVKEESEVKNSMWRDIAQDRAKTIEIDLKHHLDPQEKENESAWIEYLKRYLKKAQIHH